MIGLLPGSLDDNRMLPRACWPQRRVMIVRTPSSFDGTEKSKQNFQYGSDIVSDCASVLDLTWIDVIK